MPLIVFNTGSMKIEYFFCRTQLCENQSESINCWEKYVIEEFSHRQEFWRCSLPRICSGPYAVCILSDAVLTSSISKRCRVHFFPRPFRASFNINFNLSTNDYGATTRVTLPVGLVHVQNSLAAVFASCADEKQVTVIDFSLGTTTSGYKTNGR